MNVSTDVAVTISPGSLFQYGTTLRRVPKMSAWLLYLIGDMAVRLHVHKTDVATLTPEAAGPFGV